MDNPTHTQLPPPWIRDLNASDCLFRKYIACNRYCHEGYNGYPCNYSYQLPWNWYNYCLCCCLESMLSYGAAHGVYNAIHIQLYSKSSCKGIAWFLARRKLTYHTLHNLREDIWANICISGVYLHAVQNVFPMFAFNSAIAVFSESLQFGLIVYTIYSIIYSIIAG